MNNKLNSLPKNEIIRKKKEFDRIFSTGIRFSDGKLTVFVCFGNEQKAGFAVSKSVGKAVRRNKVKRWMRESYRTHKHLVGSHVEMVLLIREWDDTLNYFSLKDSLVKIINDINKYNEYSGKESNNLSD